MADPSKSERAPLTPDAGGDARVIAGLDGVVGSYGNTASWYNNASFVVPLAATVLVAIAGLLSRRADLLGFAAFLAAVTAVMVPVVLVGWRQTPTSIVLTRTAMISLHKGAVLKSLPWAQVSDIRRRETQGNLRWEIRSKNGERILLDGEIDRLGLLVEQARSLAGLPASERV
jgi:hypothetical protein